MTSRDQTIAGVVALLVIIAVYLVVLTRALATKGAARAEPTSSVTVIEREVIPLVSTLELNGQLPVTVSPEELGKDNPFGR